MPRIFLRIARRERWWHYCVPFLHWGESDYGIHRNEWRFDWLGIALGVRRAPPA